MAAATGDAPDKEGGDVKKRLTEEEVSDWYKGEDGWILILVLFNLMHPEHRNFGVGM